MGHDADDRLLLGALQGSLFDSMHGDEHRSAVLEAALIAPGVTVSGTSPHGAVSPFRGVLAGIAAYAVLPRPAPGPGAGRRP